MPSAWIVVRVTSSGEKRYRVEFRIGGRESRTRYGGSFKRKADADVRVRWINGEIAARRIPDLGSLEKKLTASPKVSEAAKRWQAGRLDIAESTKLQHRVSLKLMIGALGDRRTDDITAIDIADAVVELAKTHKRETIRKAVNALAMTLDHARVLPNPARDRITIRLPRKEHEEINPPTAAHVLAAHDLMPTRYRLPLLALDDTGMRISELEGLTWGDVDEARCRWRVTANVSKTGRARWVKVHPAVFAAVIELCPRDDRTPTRRVFQGFVGDAFRTHLGRVCIAAAIPAFSPHDLRHRRISLLHLGGVPWARIGEQVGQRSIAVTADTYTHVLVDEEELDYGKLLERDRRARTAPASVPTSISEMLD